MFHSHNRYCFILYIMATWYVFIILGPTASANSEVDTVSEESESGYTITPAGTTTTLSLPVSTGKNETSTMTKTDISPSTTLDRSLRSLDLLIAVSDSVDEESFPNRTALVELLKKVSDRISNLTGEIGVETYIRNVKILVPSTWSIPDKQASFETFSDANVIIDHPNEIYGNTPYTKQTGGCMKEGEYVHITPEFLNTAVNASIRATGTYWGMPEDVIVHELFHQLFGVFDEYQEGRGEEINVTNVCPKNTDGEWIPRGTETSCQSGTDQCVFKPNDNNNPQSIMGYIHLKNTTTHICTDPDDDNQTVVSHNRGANTKHNRKCNFRSVASVIREKLYSRIELQLYANKKEIYVEFLKKRAKRRIVVVVERRLYDDKKFRETLKRSFVSYTKRFLEGHDELGLVAFDTKRITVLANLTKINVWLVENWTSIQPPHIQKYQCISGGVLAAREEVIALSADERRGAEILLITTDERGNDCTELFNYKSNIFKEGTIVNTILINPNRSNKSNTTIETFTKFVNGAYFETRWKFGGNQNREYRRLPIENVLSRSGTSSRKVKSLQLKETKEAQGSFFVDPQSVDSVTLVMMVIDTTRVDVLNVAVTPPNSTAQLHILPKDVNEISLNITNRAAGIWKFNISTDDRIKVTIDAKSVLPWSETIRAKAWTNVQSVDFSNDDTSITAPKIFAEVTRGYLPVLDAQVTAVVTTANGTTFRVPLHDTGAGPDVTKDDGVYTSYLASFTDDGSYSIDVEIGSKNDTKIVKRKTHNAAFDPNTLRIDSGGLIPLLLEEFERYATTPDISVDNVPTGGDLFPPSPVTDLELYVATDKDINLKFTPPGDDLNLGDASGFVVYFAYKPHEDYMNVLDNYTYQGQSPTMYTSNQKIVKLETNLTHPTLYFTIRFFDDESKYAPYSNIVSYNPSSGEIGTYGPPVTAPTIRPTTSRPVTILPPRSPPGLSSEVIIALASCSLVAILIISVTVVICIWLRKRKSPKKGNPSPETQPPPAYDIAARWNPRYDPSDPSQGSDGSQPYSGSQGSQESRPHNGRHEYGSQNSIPNTGTEPSLQGYEPPDFPGGSGYEFRPPDRNPPGLYDYNQHISLSPVPEDDPWQPSHVPVTTSRPSHPKFPAPPPPQTRHQTSNPPLPRKDGRKSTNQANRDLQSQMLSPMPFAPGLNQSPSQQPTGLPPWDDEYDQMDPDDIYHEIRLRESLRTEVYQRSVGEIKRFIHSKKNSPGHHSSSGGNGHQPRRDNRISRSSFFAEEGITDDIALPQFDSLNKEPLNMSHGNYSKGNRYGGGMGGYP